MTSIFLTRDDQVLLLYRMGSSAVPDSWVGIGGHVEPDEIGDPTAAMLRELEEEVGVVAEDIDNLALRYISQRDTGQELRFTYYFTAELGPTASTPSECDEGVLRWFDIDATELKTLDMPPTAVVALNHWLSGGRDDQVLRAIIMTPDGAEVLPLDHQPASMA